MLTKENVVIAQLNLEGCPEGTVLNTLESDRGIEDKYFKGWNVEDLMGHQTQEPYSGFRVINDEGVKVLEQIFPRSRSIITGDLFWKDYIVMANIRHMKKLIRSWGAHSQVKGWSGLVFRYLNSRHYYFYCLEGLGNLVLYRREDDSWMSYMTKEISIDRSKYYSLKVDVKGNRIRCYLDDDIVFEFVDKCPLLSGKAGFRTNTRSRLEGLIIKMSQDTLSKLACEKSNNQSFLKKIQSKYPMPILWKNLNTRLFRPNGLTSQKLHLNQPSFGKFGVDKKKGLLVKYGTQVTALDFQDNVIWQRNYNKDGKSDISDLYVYNREIDLVDQISCIMDGELAIIDGETGEILHETSLPEVGSYSHRKRHTKINPKMIFAKLRENQPLGLILMQEDSYGFSGHTIWAYDHKLNLLWIKDCPAPYGHDIHVTDINGDGLDEIAAGYNLLDHNGKIIWVMENSEYLDEGLEHADNVLMGEFDADESNGAEVVCAGGYKGFILIDSKNGKVRRHHNVGHAQHVFVAKFRSSLDGLQTWVTNRYGSYGVWNLFDGSGDKLYTFQPFFSATEGGPVVNWTGDGEELMMVPHGPEEFGLYDGFGRKVLDLSKCLSRYCSSGYWAIDWFRGSHPIFAVDIVGDTRDELVFVNKENGEIKIFTQDTPYPKGKRIYSPIRDHTRHLSLPNWKINK